MKEEAKAQEQEKDLTEEDMKAVRRMRSIKAGHAGEVGGMAYQQAIHELLNGTEEDHVRAGIPPPAGP
eukprot:14485730-Heterocapsa_arctica.AAC.1